MATLIQLFLNDFLYPWLSLFASPFKNFDMLWVTIPVILNWIFTEFYQEKKGTSLGNAIANGIVVLWVGIDWSRTAVNTYVKQGIPLDAGFFTKVSIAVLVLVYGLWIVIQGIRVKRYVSYFGRVRQITYILLIFTPIYYGVVNFSLNLFLAILLFFPVFYFAIEIIDRLIPTPKTFEEEEKMKEEQRLKEVMKAERSELKELASGPKKTEKAKMQYQQPSGYSGYKQQYSQYQQYPPQYPRYQQGQMQQKQAPTQQKQSQRSTAPYQGFPAQPVPPRHPSYEKAYSPAKVVKK